jgi:signal transduction histidine kinase
MIRLPSLRQRVLILVLVSAAVALLVSAVLIAGLDLRSYDRDVTGEMLAEAGLIGQAAGPGVLAGDRSRVQDVLDLLRLRPAIAAAAIYDEQGSLFARYALADTATGEPGEVPMRAGTAGISREDGILTAVVPIAGSGKPAAGAASAAATAAADTIGTVYLRMQYRPAVRFASTLLSALATAVLALPAAWFVTRGLRRRIAGPVQDIADVAHRVVETGDYSSRAAVNGADAVAALAQSLNAILSDSTALAAAAHAAREELVDETARHGKERLEAARLAGELETRMRERAAQLEVTNAELAVAMEQANSASQAKSAFLSSMSHELRTPLNAILGFAQILASDKLPSTPAQKKEFAHHILTSGRHLLTLINEVLDLAKVEAGAAGLTLETVPLDGMLRECQVIMAPLAAQRRIRMGFAPHCTLQVVADRTRLKQVLLNLLSNALKYNREGGLVLVECGAGLPGETAPGAKNTDAKNTDPAARAGRVRISVKDTGIGLRPDQIDALFQPFQRLDQEGGKEEGAGIGLVLTRRLVELMHGEIGVSSTPGAGSTFWIELPAAPAGLAQAASMAAGTAADKQG